MRDKDWVFVTNFDEKELKEIIMALEGAKVRFKITPEAYDVYNRPIDAHALYFAKEDAEKAGEGRFWEYLALIRKNACKI